MKLISIMLLILLGLSCNDNYDYNTPTELRMNCNRVDDIVIPYKIWRCEDKESICYIGQENRMSCVKKEK